MREPIINSDDLDEDVYGGSRTKYNGELFSGTVIFDDTNPVSYTEYKNGEEDGKSVSYHRNGQLEEDAVYVEGEYISGKQWYQNGQLRYDSENNQTILDEDGLLTRINGDWFYKNGNKRNEGGRLFSSDGKLAVLTEPSNVIVNNYPTSKITYYNRVLINSFQEIQANIYLHPEDNFSYRGGVEVLLSGWIISLYNHNRKDEALRILRKMINDSEQKLKTGLNFRIKHLEENFIHNSNILIKRLQRGDFKINPTVENNNRSIIIFD